MARAVAKEGKKKKKGQISQWRMILTPRIIVIILMAFTVIFISVGAGFFVITSNLYSLEIKYDEVCEKDPDCVVWFNITEDLHGNVAILYKLYGFYQNHRRITESRSYPQLAGKYLTYKELSSCEPAISVNNSKEPKDLYLPCGLNAFDYFNDSYIWQDEELHKSFSQTNISLASDRENAFAPLNPKYTEGKYIMDNPLITTDEHFIVWMRTAAMPTFIKLYSRCMNCTIPAGNYSMAVSMKYPRSMFAGQRALVLTTTTAIGSGSTFISVAYIALGGISFLFGISFLVQMLTCPRVFGDLSSIWASQAEIIATARPTASSLALTKSLKNIGSGLSQTYSPHKSLNNTLMDPFSSDLPGEISISEEEHENKDDAASNSHSTAYNEVETNSSASEQSDSNEDTSSEEDQEDTSKKINTVKCPRFAQEAEPNEQEYQSLNNQPRHKLTRKSSIVTSIADDKDISSSDEAPTHRSTSRQSTSRKSETSNKHLAIPLPRQYPIQSPDRSDSSTDEFALSSKKHSGHFSSRSSSSIHPPKEIQIIPAPSSPRAKDNETDATPIVQSPKRKKRMRAFKKRRVDKCKGKKITIQVSSSSNSSNGEELDNIPVSIKLEDVEEEDQSIRKQKRPISVTANDLDDSDTSDVIED